MVWLPLSRTDQDCARQQHVVDQIEEVVMDSAKAQAVIDASKSSMGRSPFKSRSLGSFIFIGHLNFKAWTSRQLI